MSVSRVHFMNFVQWMHGATWVSSENSSYSCNVHVFYLLCATFWKQYWNRNLELNSTQAQHLYAANLSFVWMNLKVIKSVFHLTECAPTHGNIMYARGVQHVTRVKFAPKKFYLISYKTSLVGQQDRTTCPRQTLCNGLPSGENELKFVLLQKKSILSSV